MARKLYIFKASGRHRTEQRANAPMKLLGAFNTSYTFLGDYRARMLGVGNPLPGRPVPLWLHTNPAVEAKAGRGGASRLDKEFRGWG